MVLHRFIISALRDGALLCLQTIEAEEWMEALQYPYISFRNDRFCRLGSLYLQETLPNMLNQIRRLSAIVNKLSGIKEYVGKEELLEAMSGDMAENGSCGLRTLQRDIRTIEEVFGMEIKYVKGEGYHIVGRDPVYTDRFKDMLSEFEILSSVGADSGTRDFIIPEQRTVTFRIDIHKVLKSIKQRRRCCFCRWRWRWWR